MPTDSLYGQHYSVGGLAQRLRQDRADYQHAMEGRRGAWATLLSLFRLVYDGGGSTEAYLSARHGDLFDPDAYPFLEGRPADTSYSDGPLSAVPAISDDVVEQVLTKLLLLDGQRSSFTCPRLKPAATPTASGLLPSVRLEIGNKAMGAIE